MDQEQQQQQQQRPVHYCGKRRFSDEDDVSEQNEVATAATVAEPKQTPPPQPPPVVVLKSVDDVQRELYALMLLLSVLSNRISAFDNARGSSGQVQNIEETAHTSLLTTSELVDQMMEYRQLLTMAKTHFGYANFDFDSIIGNMHDIARQAQPMIEAEGRRHHKV